MTDRKPTATRTAATGPSALLSGTRLHRGLSTRTTRTHSAAVIGALAFLAIVNTVLDALYARSGFPVPYAEGQTTFDGSRLKEFYAVMIERGSLDVYWATQLFDYVFMAALSLFALTLGSRLLRAAERIGSSRLASLAAGGSVAVVVGAAFDAVENLISFVMLARPQSFADWIAIPYSSVATAKFAAVTIGALLLLAACAATLFRAIRRQPPVIALA